MSDSKKTDFNPLDVLNEIIDYSICETPLICAVEFAFFRKDYQAIKIIDLGFDKKFLKQNQEYVFLASTF